MIRHECPSCPTHTEPAVTCFELHLPSFSEMNPFTNYLELVCILPWELHTCVFGDTLRTYFAYT